MKKIILAVVLSGALISCKNSDGNKTELDDSAITENLEGGSGKTETNYVLIDSDEALVAASLMAAPEVSRDGCTVIGYNMAGEFVTFKEGDNEFIVLVDDPKKSGLAFNILVISLTIS